MAEDRHARLRTEILDIASRIIRERGLASLQARRVAEAANCSVGTLYNVYGNLDRLVIAVNMITLDRLKADIENVVGATQADALEKRLNKLAETYLDFASRERNAWRALFEHRLTAETSVPEDYRARQAELFDIVDRTLESSGDGVMRQTHVSESRAIFGAVHGIVSLALDEKLNDFDDEATRAAVVYITSAIARGATQA